MLREKLDAEMLSTLRSGRYRPLPPLMPGMLGEVSVPRRPIATLGPRVPHLISDETMRRAGRLQVQTDLLAKRLERMAEKAAEMEAMLTKRLEKPLLDMRRIIRVVSELSGVSEGDLVSARRGRDCARPRQVVMYVARHHTSFSLPAIGRHLGHRDHTTIMHGSRKVEALLLSGDSEIAALVAAVELAIGKRKFASC